MQAHSTSPRKGGQGALVLTGPARIVVERGRLRVEDGFGNLGTRRTVDYEPPISLQSIVLLTNGGTWSDHALRMLSQNGVALYSMRQTGEVEYVISPPGGPMKPGLLRLQAGLLGSDIGLSVARSLIARKVEAQQSTLDWLARRATLPGLEEFATVAPLLTEALDEAQDEATLRLVEARAAEAYFTAWRNMPVVFVKPAKGCVDAPSHWRAWRTRLSRRTGTNQDATDPLNAMLNFAYAVAAAETTLCCRASSLDPCLGVLHADRDGRASFIYDLMEPLRPIVDRLLLEMVTTRSFRVNYDFMLLREGVCRIGIELAAEIAQLVSARVRAEADRVVSGVRHALLSVAHVTYRVPRAADEPAKHDRRRPDGSVLAEALKRTGTAVKAPASPPGICCRCGIEVGGTRRYCDPCRSKRFSENWHRIWEERRASGHDPAHGGDAAVKRGEAMARSHALKPRDGTPARASD